MMHRKLISFTILGAILVLILDSKTAVLAASDGIDLCLKTVIPALLPFFFLSDFLIHSSNSGTFRILKPIASLFHIPTGLESLLIPSFLGGYPCGAKSIHSAWRNGQLQKGDAERLLAFCNNAGPSFVFGIISQILPNIQSCWAIWGILFLSSLLTSSFFPCLQTTAARISHSGTNATQMMNNALKAMCSVCGWVILFRILISFLERWFLWILPLPLRTAFCGILEITNGCYEASKIHSIEIKTILLSCMLSLGGVCVAMQTAAVTGGLSLQNYFTGKLIQTGFCFLLSFGLTRRQLSPLLLCIALYLIARKRSKKICSFPDILGV